jgi:hypothetical protein
LFLPFLTNCCIVGILMGEFYTNLTPVFRGTAKVRNIFESAMLSIRKI